MPLPLIFSRITMSSITSPLYLLGPPLLLLISLPLAILASVTTTIAITALTIRVSIVYFELGVALIHSYLFPPPQRPVPKKPSGRLSPHRARNRRSSAASTSSSHDTAGPSSYPPRLQYKSGSFVSLVGTSEITRDFEGVGGWRVPGDDDEEALWMGMNSRLELPAVIPKQRKHQRSLTGGSQRWSGSPEVMRMSPMQSRARTPVQTAGDEKHGGGDYFPPQPNMRPLSAASDRAGRTIQDGRRKSGSSTSSGSSHSRRPSATMKQAGG
ncbi:hypothetical protein K505DRAFT_153201 [Melanomma pulvis-pyrius CBS 109.77]|uniref:Uncharacterized protein n=1 Tax=Melanomma pulvis-pyrius CBS 109.77 TaxID=1314802 RepID=A0A6A6XKP6_9PLEO|nr:hypothetical protein K505DRAFT_153201 [Melanomma pulvis-pyrius CBS 109.77]